MLHIFHHLFETLYQHNKPKHVSRHARNTLIVEMHFLTMVIHLVYSTENIFFNVYIVITFLSANRNIHRTKFSISNIVFEP